MCYYSLFQGIFLTQGSKLSLLHYRQILYHLRHQRSSSGKEIWPKGNSKCKGSKEYLRKIKKATWLKWIVSQCSGNDFVKGNLAILLFFLILPMHWVTKEILPYFCRLLYPCVVCKISLHAQIYFAFLILHFKLPVSHQEMLFGMLQTRKCCLIGNKWKPWRMNQK